MRQTDETHLPIYNWHQRARKDDTHAPAASAACSTLAWKVGDDRNLISTRSIKYEEKQVTTWKAPIDLQCTYIVRLVGF